MNFFTIIKLLIISEFFCIIMDFSILGSLLFNATCVVVFLLYRLLSDMQITDNIINKEAIETSRYRTASQMTYIDEVKYSTASQMTYIDEVINKHEKILAKKYLECMKVDEYGIEFFDYKSMDKNIEYFYNNVIMQNLSKSKRDEINSNSFKIYEKILEKSKIAYANYRSKNTDIENLDHNAFEHECAIILRKSGWKTTVTKKTADNGIDIIGFKNNKKSVFQCKKYSKPVGIKAVQEIHGGKAHENADYAYVVTNNTYTSSAHALAKKTGVTLLHYSDLENL